MARKIIADFKSRFPCSVCALKLAELSCPARERRGASFLREFKLRIRALDLRPELYTLGACTAPCRKCGRDLILLTGLCLATSGRVPTTPPAWQGDLSPIFYGPFNPPKINGVSTGFLIIAQKTIADFQIAFSVLSLRVETRRTLVPCT